MPVLAHDDKRPSQADVPAVNSGNRQPVDNAGSGNNLPVTSDVDPLPAAIPDVPEDFFDDVIADVADVPVLAQAPKPSRAAGWRIERFGAPGADGKGRYWQWRRGTGKARQSAYGGKV